LEGFLAEGGRLVIVGELGTNLGDRMAGVLASAGSTPADAFAFDLGLLPYPPQVRLVEGRADLALTLQRVERGCALHFIRYDYDEVADRVPRLDRLVLEVRVPFEVRAVTAFSPRDDLIGGGEPGAGGSVRLTLREVPLYGILLIS